MLQAIFPFLTMFSTAISLGRQNVALCGNGLKKMLFASISSTMVFRCTFFQGHYNTGLLGKELILSKTTN